MKKYNHILFDLDHTLWDFEKNSAETLSQLYDAFHLSKYGKMNREDFISKFREVNAQLWSLYDQNRIGKEYLRDERFKLIFEGFGVKEDETAKRLGRDYLRICPEKEHVMPHAYEVLEYLSGRYRLHIVTNGFRDVQSRKLAFSRLGNYFTRIITSEEAGFKKPDRGFFEYVLSKLEASNSECVMVGDNIETDIRGAFSVDMDIIFFNPGKLPHDEKVNFEITSLLQMKDIL